MPIATEALDAWREMHCNSLMKQFASIVALITCIFSIFVGGCASPSDPSSMVPTNARITKTRPNTVNVAVSGGRETNPMWTSQAARF